MQGFINVFKPSGVTSARVVAILKKKYHLYKVGHMGTLDPMAEGVLPIAIGKATRMFDYFLSKTKCYRLKMKFGVCTDTLDSSGKVTHESGVIPTKSEIIDVLPSFVGEIEQIPPVFSAKNIDGVRAYSLARSGHDVQLKPCKVTINKLEYVNYAHGELELICDCGSGTYIRSLVRDIASKLNTYATMTYLCRITSGNFNIENSVDIEKYDGKLEDIVLPITSVFSHISVINVNKFDAQKLCNGLTIKTNISDDICFVKCDNNLLGVAVMNNGMLKLKTYLKEEN